MSAAVYSGASLLLQAASICSVPHGEEYSSLSAKWAGSSLARSCRKSGADTVFNQTASKLVASALSSLSNTRFEILQDYKVVY